MSEQDIPDIHLKVLYDFEYLTKDGRKVIIKEGEKLFLIKKTNTDWWQVIRSSAERPFYVPATYVEEYSWGPIRSKEITRSSVRRHQEKKLNVPTASEMKNIPKRLPSDKEESTLHNNDKIRSSCSSTGSETSNRNSYKQSVESSSQKGSFSEDHTKILHDKRKSWAVEELVAELSKMRSEKNETTDLESVNNKHLNESVLPSGQNIMHSSVNMTSDNKIMSLSDYPLSIEKDNIGSVLQRSQSSKKVSSEENINSTGGVYSVVCPASLHGQKNVGNVTSRLSDSLEKLAQQIQFEPIATSSSRSTPTKLSRSLEEQSAAMEDSSAKMDSMFSRMKNKLGYSSSFKTKKELQQVMKRGVGNSVLSTSWEISLSEPQTSINNEGRRSTIQNERVLRTSSSALESVKGEAKILDGQLKPCRSGSELDVLEQRGETKKSPTQSWNLLRHKVRSGKLKKIMCVSESESEEYLDESAGQDEGSISGLSDDNLLLQSSTSKVCSDISDGAISDDLFISTESIRDSDGCKDQTDGQRRKVSLTRGNRVDSHGSRHYSSPPSPLPGHQPVRVLNEGWQEYRTPQGRTFYYNSKTRDKSWKPPRRQHKQNENAEDGSIENLRSDSSSPLAEANGSSGTSYVPVPKGWREAYDDETGQPCYVSDSTGAKWFSSNDSEGRIYFFEENSNESSWTLPELRVTTCDSPTPNKQTSKETNMGAKKPTKEEKKLEGDVQLRSEQLGKELEAKSQYRMAKAHSMALLESSGKQASSKSSSFPRNWPQLWDGNMCVLKEGTLNRTKITENGKKLRKNWAPAHVVLTELFLLFFKDAKAFAALKNSQGESSSAARPEFSVDLNGALLEDGEKVSSRRNVFLVSTVLGLQVLLQCESGPQAEEWYQAIRKAITDLPSAYDSCPRNKAPKLSPSPYLGSHSPEEFKKSSRIGRSRSVKSVKLSAKEIGSQEDLTFSPDENQTKIKNRLKKFFHRRPTREALVKKGIYKDEPVFGCLLSDVCKGESPRVPAFVQRCIAAIECKEENMKTDGLYRASGNLSQVQKIRLQVDQNNLLSLELEEDVHVLTGALKLFFRELKKPLIPFEYFNKALKASTNQNKKEKLQQFRDIVKALPHPNRDTLEYLLRHLLRVTKYQESNRMHIPNLAIVFGPTLMWPESESLNMALDLMQQNLVIECFLQEFESIFR